MSYINNLGDYVELLHALLSQSVGENATVQYSHESDKQDKPRPFIKLPLPEIIGTSRAADGRHQDQLAVTVNIKVPKNVSNPSVEAANIGGFVRALMTGQYFLAPEQMGEDRTLDFDFDCVDEPEEITGYELKWNDNDQGYAIAFEQTIRYGNLEAETFLLTSITTQEGDSEASTVYESDESST